MDSDKPFQCQFCGKGFNTEGYKSSHLQQNKTCNKKWQQALGIDIGFNPIGRRLTRSRARGDSLGAVDTGRPAKAPRRSAREEDSQPRLAIPQALADEDARARSLLQGDRGSEDEEDDRKPAADPRIGNEEASSQEGNGGPDSDGGFPENLGDSDDELGRKSPSEASQPSLEGSVATIPGAEATEADAEHGNAEGRTLPNDKNIKAFRAYCTKAKQFPDLDEKEVRGIKLLDILRRKKTPMDAYDELLGWYLEEAGLRIEKEPLGKCPDYLSRAKLIRILKERYNMDDKFPFSDEIVVPHSNARIKVICRNAGDCVEQLFTDPGLTDEDFSFFNNDPMAPPPENLTYVGELNTGEAYRNAYHEFVEDPENEIGVAAQFYIDGAVTGQFDNLSVTALKMSMSCFTLDYRKKDRAWAIVGFVVTFSEGKSRGKKMFAESLHDQALEEMGGMLVDEEGEPAKNVPKSQDFHAQLKSILRSYVQLEASGMLWDLHYRGKLYRNKKLVFWTGMVRADTDEAELLCGKYRSRSGNVKHLCRYCHCPNDQTDNVRAAFDAKTVTEIQDLIDNKDLEGLKAISQQYIDNAWYKLRFDPTYDTGIHGACPSEMLHAIHLGIFLYVKECFFAQIGPTSQLAKDIDGLAQKYGELFRHNSERDLPNCKFTHGIKRKRKLMATEYRGVLLVIAAILRSTLGRRMLQKNKHFQLDAHVKDWLMLVESLLEWEAYLCEPKMRLADVKRLEHKNRFIMYLFAKIARRTEGMGLRVFKFHAITHMASDIKLYGVPKEHDTGTNESGHKVTKVAAKLTQKNMATFESQTATRLMEFLLIEWAMAELNGHKLWDYYGKFDPIPSQADDSGSVSSTTSGESSTNPQRKATKKAAKEVPEPATGGAMMVVERLGEEDPHITLKANRPSRNRSAQESERLTIQVGDDLVDFLLELQEKVEEFLELEDYELPIYTQHTRNGQVFYGHPKYRGGGKWRDWALFDWGDPAEGGYGELPGHIQCFVTLDGLDVDPEGPGIKHGGVYLANETYAVVESAKWVTKEDEVTMSDLFVPLQKEVKRVDSTTGKVLERKFYLADVDAIVSPLCVVPDIGAKPSCKYFNVKPRTAWVDEFVAWLRDPASLDDMSD